MELYSKKFWRTFEGGREHISSKLAQSLAIIIANDNVDKIISIIFSIKSTYAFQCNCQPLKLKLLTVQSLFVLSCFFEVLVPHK